MEEFIVGRSGNQPFTIQADSVSSQHCKITLTDQGEWILEDLKGPQGNGTFIQDAKGNFLRISKKQISEDTIIRLGQGGHHSYTFMAHRVLAQPGNYSYEFIRLKALAEELKQQEQDRETLNNRHMLITKLTPLFGLFISLAVTNVWLLRCAMTLPSLFVGLAFNGDTTKLKELRQRTKTLIVCPCCGRPLSDYEVENMQCTVCKAK